MLYWILLNKESLMVPGDIRSSNEGDRLDVDFVTSRGNLARILDVLNGKDGKGRKWTLLATRFRGTVYLSHIEDVDRDYQQSVFSRRVCYWGKRFEVEVTENWAPATSFPGSSSGPLLTNEVERHGPLKAYPGFFSVVRFQLENHRIALRAEVDAEMQSLDEAQNPRSNYVELKVTTETIVRAPWAFERKRLVPWWCQSIISGTPLIVYGIRDYDGHVTSIDHVRTDDIPDRVGRENLDPEKYLLFLSDILTWIKSIVCLEDVTSVYAFQWDPNAPGRGVTANALLRDAGNTFLHEWYVREMEDYFALAGEQRQRKGVERAMEDEKQRKGEKIKMKGIRKRMEESWPRTKSSREPDVRIEKPPARGQDVRYTRSRSPGFHNATDRGTTTFKIRDSEDEERYSRKESFGSERYKREHPRPASPGFHNDSDRGRTTSEIRDLEDEQRYLTTQSFGSEGYKREHPHPRSLGCHNASDREGITSEIRHLVDEEPCTTRESFRSERYKREHPRTTSPGFHNTSERGRTTSEIRNPADEKRYSSKKSFGSEGYPRPSATREDNERRPLLYEDQFDRDRTSPRVYDQRPELYSSRSSRDKSGKTRRYERRRHGDQVQQQARARSRKTFNESRSQRFSEREYPSSTDRMPTKRVKRDAEYEIRGIRHQDSTR